ncbi:MAG: RpiB/LacA/LacB family sugar-phosphate isomerase, partial [Clostridia bacterium]|nr:RpiB/LacA/LacB family sugar-phosphate isomerase [Clostridia bacterium]
MKIVIGCDHAATELKEIVKKHIEEKGYEVCDVGTYTSDSCHYPVYAHAACERILSGECELGILICGTGIGMSMAANKHKGIRAACCSDTF